MAIKAIETVYKGYRFRSRLEARWAVFFDERGDEWRYEPEGFELTSGRYLPDFYLPAKKMYVEIKPGNAPKRKTPLVYMAGRMTEGCYRPFDIRVDPMPTRPVFSNVKIGSTDIKYCGPFKNTDHDHCSVHGVYDDGSSESEVFDRSMWGVDICDLFFAYFDDHKAFGTLVEIGAAKAKGKRIIVGFDSSLNFEDFEATDRINDLWFAARCADVTFVGNRGEILANLENWISTHHGLTREQRLIKELSEATGERAAIYYGDPVDALDDEANTLEFFQGEASASMLHSWSREETHSAAFAARQSRFEHGQSGAA